MPEPGVKHGGVVQMAHVLAQGLALRGHEVTVWTYSPRPSGALYRVKSLPGERFARNWLGARLTFGLLGNIFFTLPSYKDLDVLVAHGDTALLWLRRPEVVRIMHGSGLGEALNSRNPLRFFLQLIIFCWSFSVHWCKGTLLELAVIPLGIILFVRKWICNGVDTQFFRPNESMRSRNPSILFVGTLGGRKRGTWLVELFQKYILPVHPDAVLHLVTEDGEQLPGLVYHSGITQDELSKLYQHCWDSCITKPI